MLHGIRVTTPHTSRGRCSRRCAGLQGPAMVQPGLMVVQKVERIGKKRRMSEPWGDTYSHSAFTSYLPISSIMGTTEGFGHLFAFSASVSHV